MNYRDRYYQLLKEENFESLRNIFANEGILEFMRVKTVELKTEFEIPYILFTSDFDNYHAAQYLGFVIDIRQIITNYTDENFYLPVVSFCDSHPEFVQKLINKKISIQHEVIHIRDFFEILENDPNYTRDLLNYGLYFPVKNQDIEKSVNFEVKKLFLIEPNGLTHDHASYERYVYEQFMGRLMKYKCDDLHEYLQMKMKNYLDEYISLFKNKFRNESERIDKEFEKSINQYGKSIFGDNPFQQYQTIKKEYAGKLLNYSVSNFKH